MMEGRGIGSVHGEAKAVADHGADQGAFDVANRESHADHAPSADRSYQSRRGEGGKRGSFLMVAFALAGILAFCAASWRQNLALVIFLASALLWLVPLHPRWWRRRVADETGEEEHPARRSAADIAVVLACWVLATWALWQHRMLPLVVCAAAGVLVLIDVASRPAAPLPLCIPERTRRRPIIDPDPQLQR